MTITGEKRDRKPPRTAGVPVVGPMVRLIHDPIKFMKDMDRVGPVVRVRLGSRELYFVNHPDLVNEILVTRAEDFSREGTGYKDRLAPLTGDGLGMIDGEHWSRARRMMRPVFTQRSLSEMSQTMVSVIGEHLASWKSKVDQGNPLHLSSELTKITMSAFTEMIFGYSLSAQEREQLDRDFEDVRVWINWRIWTPGLPEWWPLPGRKRGEQALTRLNGLLYRLIEERRREPDAYQDLLSVIVNARSEDDGSVFTEVDVRDHAMNLFFAGLETTAITCAWTLALLEQHPAWEERVLAEVDEVLSGRTPTFDDWQKLKIVRACWEEAMRMYPPAFINGRSAVADCELGGYHVPKDTMVVLNVVGAHYHPDFWENSDAFDPGRFLGERDKARHPGAYYPFGMGPRMCIGKHMGTVEAIFTIAMVYQRYRLALHAGSTIKPKVKMSIQFQDGPLVDLEERRALSPTGEPERPA